jgi:hypothetical protein
MFGRKRMMAKMESLREVVADARVDVSHLRQDYASLTNRFDREMLEVHQILRGEMEYRDVLVKNLVPVKKNQEPKE